MNNTLSVPDNILLTLAAGRREVARQALLKLVNEQPNNTLAWLCLASSVPKAQAILALRRVLMLEPSNQAAQRSLERLNETQQVGYYLNLDDILVTPTAPLAPAKLETVAPIVETKAVEEEEVENLAAFGQEQATMNINMVEAKFGEESPTLPEAFRYMLHRGKGKSNGKSAKTSSQKPISIAEYLNGLSEKPALLPDLPEVVAPPVVALPKLIPVSEPELKPFSLEELNLELDLPAAEPPLKPALPMAIRATPRRTFRERRNLVSEQANFGSADSGSLGIRVRPPKAPVIAAPEPASTELLPTLAAYINKPIFGLATYGLLIAIVLIAILFGLYWVLG